MSVYATVRAKAAPGKMGAAMGWAIEVRELLNNTYSLGTEVLTNIGADAWTIHWVTKYDSLAQYEETYAKIMADEGYQALVQEGNEAGLASEVTTSLFNVAP